MKTPIITLIALFMGAPFALQAADERPNIIFIYADDWGWGDLACHGREGLMTPNLDRLAKEGTDFEQFVVCNPVCSPSRVAIVTGNYPARHFIHQHFGGPEQNAARSMPDWLDPEVTLLPRLMKDAGYATAHFGKWHLSGHRNEKLNQPIPTEYGYDESAVWGGPGPQVFEGSNVTNDTGMDRHLFDAIWETTAAADHVLRFIREKKDDPFFVNFWIHETHHLVAATEEQKALYPDTPEPDKTYFAAVTRADAEVGRIMALLDELELTDNTMVIFSSDNGPELPRESPESPYYYQVGVTGGMRGKKRSLYMGGVNVPFIVRWPNQVPAGRVDKTNLIGAVDMLPTFLAAAGIPMPEEYESDGENVMAAFQGKEFARSEPLFWEWRGGGHKSPENWPELAMRDGFHTLVMTQDAERVELYDVSKDRGQENNLAESEPERTAEMVAALKAWKASLPYSAPYQAGPDPKEDPAEDKEKPAAKMKQDPEKLKGIFAGWDADKDGSLSLEEYKNGPKKKEGLEEHFKKFDKNSDGMVSIEEFLDR